MVFGNPNTLHQYFELTLDVLTRRDPILVFRIEDKILRLVVGVSELLSFINIDSLSHRICHSKTRLAPLAGPTATIQNTLPLVTSNKAWAMRGLSPRLAEDGEAPKFEALRAQRLAVPVNVHVEQFSAHPLESAAAYVDD